MARSHTTLRLFVAAYPPMATRAAMAALLEDHRKSRGWPECRPVPPDQLHLTLQFIGDRREQELADVESSVARSVSGIAPARLTPIRLISLPRRGPARLVAIETDAPPSVLEIHRRLAHRLARNPGQHAADRFLPHLTLGRFTHPAHGLDVDESITMEPFSIERVALVRSVLHPSGAEHRVLREFPLDGDRTSPSAPSGGGEDRHP